MMKKDFLKINLTNFYINNCNYRILLKNYFLNILIIIIIHLR